MKKEAPFDDAQDRPPPCFARADAPHRAARPAVPRTASHARSPSPRNRGEDCFEAAIAAALERLPGFDEEGLARFLKGLSTPVQRGIFHLWRWQAHGGQSEPAGPWRNWLLQAGRGFGKTRAGAEWVWARAREAPGARIALVAPTLDDVARVMVEGESGLIAVARADEAVLWRPTLSELVFPSGARAFGYSGGRPSRLRGPQHHFAWGDELAQWRHAEATWDNLQLGLRLGERPRCVLTTTPRPMNLIKAIAALPGTCLSRGRTADNPFLAEGFVDAVTAMYGGTRLGRQELEGELVEEADGALWPRALIEASRVRVGDSYFPEGGGRSTVAARESNCPWRRIVVGVDPPASAAGTCGIVAAGVSHEEVAYVLADASASGLSPEGWARKVAAAAEAWGAHRVVAEANNGGRMVESVLRGASVHLPLKLVHAAEGKVARAEPVAALFESGRAKLAGTFPELEDELAGLSWRGGYEGPGDSPDRADAMVWALTELMLRGPPQAEPRVRTL